MSKKSKSNNKSKTNKTSQNNIVSEEDNTLMEKNDNNMKITNIGLYSSTIKELRGYDRFEEIFQNKCRDIGIKRYSTHKSSNSRIEPLHIRDIKDYCKCSLNKLGDKTIDDIKKKDKEIENKLHSCVTKLHKSQKTRSKSKSKSKSQKTRSKSKSKSKSK